MIAIISLSGTAFVGRIISDGGERKRLAHLAGTMGIMPTKN
jgi:hypothetical protein